MKIYQKKKNIEKKGLYSLEKNKFLMNSPCETVYIDKMRQNLKNNKKYFQKQIIKYREIKHETKEITKDIILYFQIFSYKWNKDKNDSLFNEENNKIDNNNISSYANKNYNYNDYKHIINDKYSEIIYEDNLIFNFNYTNFVNERLEYILLNNIENNNTKLESCFNDLIK